MNNASVQMYFFLSEYCCLMLTLIDCSIGSTDR